MMARTESRGADRPVSLTAVVLRVLVSAVLGFVALFGLTRLTIVVKVLNDAGLLWGPVYWVTTGRLATFLLIFAGAVAGVLWLRPWKAIMAMSSEARDEDSPETLNTGVMGVLLGFLTLMGLSAAAGAVAGMLFNPRVEHPANWLAWTNLAATLALVLLIGGGALWGLVRLKPWRPRGPISPSTRRTNALFGLSGMVTTPGVLALMVSTWSDGNPSAFFSNSPVVLWIALFAIAGWLLGMAIGWWWYFSADEHERKAYDFGSVVGAGLFTVLTPAWWVAARAGLVPPPDAMVLWIITMVAISIGWMWHRYR
jgi:hypothetical protein